jgi:predicted ATP-grasp superfamily ATP-dependent carboligase
LIQASSQAVAHYTQFLPYPTLKISQVLLDVGSIRYDARIYSRHSIITMSKFKILVLDAAQRSALAVVRSLGQRSELEVFTAEADTSALAGESRFSQEFLTCPSAEHQPLLFVEWLADTQSRFKFDLVLPVTEITSQLILLNKQQLVSVRTAFPEYAQVMQLADKSNLVKLAQKLGLTYPASQHFNQLSELDPNTIHYPCVVKPFQSRLFKDNQWINTCVGIIRSQAELQNYLGKNTYLNFSGFMLQEFIPGHGAGVFCLYNRGQAVTFFAHKRLREKPPQGGVSVYCESQDVDPTLRDTAEKLLTEVGWHGVAMVEFRIDEKGNAYLMEINTRFWGSLQLSIDSGLDFPWLLVAQSLGIEHPPPTEYRKGQRLRWLLGDVDSLYLYFKSSASIGAKFKRLLWFLTPDLFNSRHEIDRLSDLKPAVYELKKYISAFLGK